MGDLLEGSGDEAHILDMFEGRTSPVNGIGLFVKEKLARKGTTLDFNGKWLAMTSEHHEVYKDRHPLARGHIICSAMRLTKGIRWYVHAQTKVCLAALANDVRGTGKTANAVIGSVGFNRSSPSSPIVLRLLRDLQPGEEVLAHYGDQFWKARRPRSSSPSSASNTSPSPSHSPPPHGKDGRTSWVMNWGFVTQDWRGPEDQTMKSMVGAPGVCMLVFQGALLPGFDYLEVIKDWSERTGETTPALRIWEKKRNTLLFHGDGTNVKVTKIVEMRHGERAGDFGIVGETHGKFNDFVLGGVDGSATPPLFETFSPSRQLLHFFHPKTGKF